MKVTLQRSNSGTLGEVGADRAGALSSICNTCGSLYCMRTSIVTCFTHHKFSLSPFVESGVFSFRLVLSARAMVAPPLQPPGPPPPPLLASALIRFARWTLPKFKFTNVTKISSKFRPAISVGGAGRTLRTWTPGATTSVETIHRHHTSHTFIHLDFGHFCVRVTLSGQSITFCGITFTHECKIFETHIIIIFLQ